MATKSWRSAYIELQDTTTWERVMLGDIEHRSDIEVVFSAADNQIAVLSSPYAIYSIRRIASHSIPGPKEGESVIRRLPSKHVMNWSYVPSWGDDSDELSGLLQVWKVKDRSECAFSLDINIGKYFDIYLAPDGFTVIFPDPTL